MRVLTPDISTSYQFIIRYQYKIIPLSSLLLLLSFQLHNKSINTFVFLIHSLFTCDVSHTGCLGHSQSRF